MNPKTRDALEQKMRQQREQLSEEALAADSELLYLTESRESELEEKAQRDRTAELMGQLDRRAKLESRRSTRHSPVSPTSVTASARGADGWCIDR